MQKKTVVSVENAYVRFNLASEKVDNLKEYVIKMVKGELLFTEFYALKDISFTIKEGDAIAIIGKNGSGKSTLLKLICGIIKPYQGKVKTLGSIAPIIELGAGFNPNLTARENTFLNGAILGFNKTFIKEHFQEIIEFAELQEFVDVPIKNFSSGMRARLGFSIATIRKPDILIIDEVLAVGDKVFKNKCEERMQELIDKNTTLIYVSHDISSVKKLCSRAIWLDQGTVKMVGNVDEVCDAYENED